MTVHKLPPELQGKAIANGPVPFLFGAQAAKLKARYYLQIITPEAKAQTEVWLEAWPRWLADAQNFKYAEMILAKDKNLTPVAVRLHHPNGTHYVVYALDEKSIAINKSPGPLGPVANVFEAPWWQPRAPRGWQTVVEEAPQMPQAPAATPPSGGRAAAPSVGSRPQQPR